MSTDYGGINRKVSKLTKTHSVERCIFRPERKTEHSGVVDLGI
ncbi:hypothetical protein JMUB7504_27400 [Staphylococcus aureus]